MPSKALLRSARALRAAATVPGAAEAITGGLDVAAVLARRDAFTSGWSDAGQVAWLSGAGIDLIRGHARLIGVREVAVMLPDGGAERLVARHAVVVATGSDAFVPDIHGLREARPWTSRDATSAKAVPATLAVLGGGVVPPHLRHAPRSRLRLVVRRR
jgi:dihydrolipoamide dehydrogenase